MSIPIFGAVPASDDYPVAVFHGEYETPYSIANGGTADTTFLSFTMPFTGALTVNVLVSAYFTTGGRQQLINYLTCAADAPDGAPWSEIWSEGGTSVGYHHATQPVFGWWNSVTSGTALVIKCHHANGTGGLTAAIHSVIGTAQCYKRV